MKLRFYLVALSALLVASEWSVARGKGGGGSVSVRGHFRKDGTYVAPHHRTAPDGSFQNNWSTKGNYNPYTGEDGKVVTPPAQSNAPSFPIYLAPPLTPAPPAAVSAPPMTAHPPETALGTSLFSAEPSAPGSSALPAVNDPVTPRLGPSTRSTGPVNAGQPLSYAEQQKLRDLERAQYWQGQGYSFNPTYMTAYSMDQKVRDIERARFWREKGYHFNPDYMTAYSMDQKVKDIERAQYWRSRGYSFNAEYMTAYSMDQKVKDIERAQYWSTRGLNFDPNYMTAYSMDREAERRGISSR